MGNIDAMPTPGKQILWLGESPLLKEAEPSLIKGSSEVLIAARPSESQTELSGPIPISSEFIVKIISP